MIEFLYENVSEPQNKRYHSWNNCGWHASSFDKKEGKTRFLQEINTLLENYKDGYYLTKAGEIHTVSPEGFQSLIEDGINSGDPENVDDRIRYAISKYLRYNSNINEKKDAVRTLADILEFYKRQDIKLDKKDDSDLFHIINSFDIRHHSRLQQSGYDKEIWYEWMFYTFLASINVLIKMPKNIS